jgi:16S rRNA processing protein RimM
MPAPIDSDALVLMGRIFRPHGIRGEIKVIPETDNPGRFRELEVLYVGSRVETAERVELESFRIQPSKKGVTVVLKLTGDDSREAADKRRGSLVFAHEGDLELQEDEYFLHELVGLEVANEQGETIGSVKDIIQLPAHDLYVVARPGGSDAMIPAVEEFILEIDLEARRMIVRPIEGLLE